MDKTLPKVFDPAGEPIKLLEKTKLSLVKKFSWTRSQPLYDAVHLAVLLHVFNRDAEAIEVCATLGRMEFNGSFHLWSAVEMALALQARLLRLRGEAKAAEQCIQRVRAAGYVDDRLEGSLLDRNQSLEIALAEGDQRGEQRARITRHCELAFISELGGSAVFPVERAEVEWEANLARLRELTAPKK